MLTDLRQVLDVTGSGAKMAQMGGNGVFFETVEKDMEIKIEKMIITLNADINNDNNDNNDNSNNDINNNDDYDNDNNDNHNNHDSKKIMMILMIIVIIWIMMMGSS